MPWHAKLTSKNEARCCAASRLPRPPPESCTRSHHRGDCQRLQAASFNAPRLHDGKRPSADMQTVDMIKRQFNDAALADVAVSSSDTEKQRSKKKKKGETFLHWHVLPELPVIDFSDPPTCSIGPKNKTDKGPFPGCLLANYLIEWLLVFSVFPDLTMATLVTSGSSRRLRVPFLATKYIY